MSLFGYPATVIHQRAIHDNWNRVTGYDPVSRNAKVVEEQKLIKNGTGEEIQSIAEIHLEGPQPVSMDDYFEYQNSLNREVRDNFEHLHPLEQVIRYDVKHIEIKKEMGTDDVKKVIVYA